MKKIFMLALAAVIMAAPAEAKKKKNSAAPVKSEVRTPAKKGLFNVQFHKDKYYFQIPDSLLGRLLMVNTRFVSTPVDAGVYGGELANSQVLYWEKRGKQLYLRANLYDTRTDSADAIALAVKNSTQDPIVFSTKIDSTITDSVGAKLYSVEVTGLFNSDIEVFAVAGNMKSRLGITNYKKDLSYIDYIHTFPINTEVVTVRTYGSKPLTKLPAGQATGCVTLKMNTSFVLLPKDPMPFRTFDPPPAAYH